MIVPMQEQFGWSRSILSAAVGVNLLLFGLTAPFAAALMEKFGIRAVTSGWRSASLLVAVAALMAVPLVLRWLRNSPADLGVTPYGSAPSLDDVQPPPVESPPMRLVSPARRAIQTLVAASRQRTFWALVAGFAICGATTNGLIGTHFIPSPTTTACPRQPLPAFSP
jgi:hypothetical protein